MRKERQNTSHHFTVELNDSVAPPTSLSTPQTPFPDDLDPFGSVSAPFPPLSSQFVSDRSLDSTLERQSNRPATANWELDPRDEGRYTIELLTFYRYHIAPRLDLGVGDQFFSVHALFRAKTCNAVCQSVLALSRCQRNLSQGIHRKVDDPGSEQHALQAMRSLANTEEEDKTTVLILLTIREVILTPPGLWSSVLHRNTNLLTFNLQEGQWQMMARLVLAAELTASAPTSRIDLNFIFQCARPVLPGQMLTDKQQLCQALANLARAFTIPGNAPGIEGQRTLLPMATVWQSCWSDCELWYFARNEEMQQIFEVDESEALAARSPSSPPFPIIIFSNVCALLANFSHHLTAIYLLHHKPRLIKPTAESGWSASPAWHAQRLVGMVATFDEAEIFDPLVIAGLIYGTRKLSHPSQLAVVANIMKKAAQTTGLQLQQEIDKIETTYGETLG
ncbi:uncharacterized protein A1O5_02020 [Cladophialophora psammophila CBS 110553]|uniref:Transcription factor domain-containing protein n=1 Tax=Cladophialophora psammophila CBS 110553 TaxID=1182543 RepID=W9XYF0_9EURO|nr:uncharacterized protein A1O5_02020 [Cladophialophora psammophila CBS 110553]EXJ75324.1 hypothetical protein A1O5_02020 [Cladophialophora psammophila CBS 110553]